MEKQEIEQKWRITRCDFLKVPEHQVLSITQAYLTIPKKEDIECRVRKTEFADKTFFYYTEKTKTKVEGVRGENEKMIEADKYNRYLALYQDPRCKPIQKTRYVFEWDNYIWELDIYIDQLEGLMVLECEVSNEAELSSLKLPDFLEGFVVTSDKRYSNRSLAEHGIPKLNPKN